MSSVYQSSTTVTTIEAILILLLFLVIVKETLLVELLGAVQVLLLVLYDPTLDVTEVGV